MRSMKIHGMLFPLLLLSAEVLFSAEEPSVAAEREIRLSELPGYAGERFFRLDLEALTNIVRKTEVDGWVEEIRCAVFTGGEKENWVSVNAATTRYQGHYVWTTGEKVSGFGTYTASKTDRSFGWYFRNDGPQPVRVASARVAYGQWGARNSLSDSLSCEWYSASVPPDPVAGEGWCTNVVNDFIAPFTNGDEQAVFPFLEAPRLLSVETMVMPGGWFALRFTDRCPPSGNNAHLGITDLEVVFRELDEGEVFTIIFGSGRDDEAEVEMRCAPGRVYKLPPNPFSPPEGSVFRGWRDGKGKLYDDGMLIFDLAPAGGTLRMTPVWEP